MSERKSAEIKFRCTPSFKASLAASAEAVGQSMSEYIETASKSRMTGEFREGIADARAALDAGPEAVTAFLMKGEKDSAADEFDSDDIVAVTATSIDEDEPPVDDAGNAVACTCRPWEFCTHKVEA